MSDQSPPDRRRGVTLTVILLIVLIALGILVGVLSLVWGAVPPGPEGIIQPASHFALITTGSSPL